MKTPKPTGNAEVPPHVERAHAIDDLMNEKAGSRDLDDEDIVDADPEVVEVSDSEEKGVASGKDDEMVVVKTEKSQTGPLARRVGMDRISADSSRTRARNNGQALLANISKALDPSMRRARADEQSVSTLQTGQIFTLSGQLRESQRQVEALRSQLAEAERRCHKAERRADRAEMMEMITESRGQRVVARHPLSPGPPPRVGRRPRGGWRSRNRFRQEIYYADGGRSTRYLGSDDNDDEVQGNKDSPGTRRYTFEEADEPDPTSLTPPSHSPSTSSPQTKASSPFYMSPRHRCRSVSI